MTLGAAVVWLVSDGLPGPAAWEQLEPGDLVYVDVIWNANEPHPLCEGEARPSDEVHLGPHPETVHLVLDVVPGAPDRFPFNDVRCEYVPSTLVVRVRGFYTPLWASIQTARNLVLRPVEVPQRRARRVIRRASR